MTYQSQSRSGGGGKEEVKVFQSTIDKSTVTTTIFSQPSFFMGVGNSLLMILTQRFPEEFMTSRYLTMSYNGLKAPALLTVPFCFISGAYLAVASIITTSPTPLKGHLLGYGVSLSFGLIFLTLRRISWYYPLLGVMYLSYGGLHHYRRMMVYGDNAPVFYWSDFGEIHRDWKQQRQYKREKQIHQQHQRAARRAIS